MIEKKIVDGIIVVEGKTDVAFLETFLDATFVTTNGSEISSKTIEYIKELSKTNRIIVLTDPDSPGNRIRKVLDEHIDGLCHAFVDKKVSIKKHKVGVAESTKEEVLKALNNLIINNKDNIETIGMSEIVELGLTGNDNSMELRLYICDYYHLGYCSTNKTFIKRLNALKINKKMIKEALNNIK